MTNQSAGTTDLYNWIGNSGGAWGSALDWQDLTSGQTPASAVPGAGDPVTINGPTGSIYEVISGGGTAASVAVSGLIDLLGIYSTGDLEVGSVQANTSGLTATSGGLILGSGAIVQAGTVGVADGTLALSGAMLSISGAVLIGMPPGYPTTSYNVYSSGEKSTLSLANGATLQAASDVTVADGSIIAQGTSTYLAISGNLLLGTTSSTTTTPPYNNAALGALAISGGATIAVSGAITDVGYDITHPTDISVSGPGSTLIGGILTLNAGIGNDTASVTAGGALRVASLSLTNTVSNLPYYINPSAALPSIYVDSTSIVEIGTADTASPGAITIDPGITVATAMNFNLFGNVVDNGTISETGKALTISGTLSGSGVVQIGAGGTLSVGSLSGAAQVQLGASASMILNGVASSGDSIAFNGAGASLTIGTAATYMAATLSGFAIGDDILVNNTALTNAVYTYAGNNTGSLALYGGTTIVETLTLAGNYSANTFLVAPTTSSGSEITLLAGATGGSSPVSNTADRYNWIGNSGGAWGSASNWQDLSLGQNPASAVPGAGDPVTINGPTGSIYEVITGGGTAASVAVSGLIDLVGTYSFGDLEPRSGGLTLGSGAVVQAGMVGVAYGTLALSGAMLSSSGAVFVGSPNGPPAPGYGGASGTLSLAAGATLKAASDVKVTDGSIIAQGTSTNLAISGNLVLGTDFPTSNTPLNNAAQGSLAISGGATVAVSGAITEAYPLGENVISVSGQGSALTGGILTLNAAANVAGSFSASATAGGTLRVSGLSLVDTYNSGTYDLPSIYVDSTSILEVGNAGTAAAGAITIDPGITVAATLNVSLFGNVVDNGTISETGNALTISGTLSGSGVVQIGAGDTLSVGGLSGAAQVQLGASASMTLNGPAASGDSIAFNGAGVTLTIGTAATYMAATLSGFAIGDDIIVNNAALTNAVYTYAGNNTGSLALYAGTTIVETLTLAGNYSANTFLVAPTANSGTAITLRTGPTGGSSPVSNTTDLYNWIGNSGGAWGNASNWQDLTSGQNPASTVPGAADPVTINGPTSSLYEVITGGGTAASVAVSGLIDLLGTYSAGSFEIGSVQTSASPITATSGALTLGSSAVVQAGTVGVADGTLALNGAMLSTSGAVIIGTPAGYPTSEYNYFSGANSTLSLANGATLQAASDVTIAYGTVIVQGPSTDLAIGGNLMLGTASSTTPTPPYVQAALGLLAISGGATLAVSGAMTEADYDIAASSPISISGPGSVLTGGTLTLNAAYPLPGQGYSASVTAGGALRVGELSLINTSGSSSFFWPLIYVDSTSILEIGNAGTAAAGAITVDPGITVAAAMNLGLFGNVVDNGTISETGNALTISGTLSGSAAVQIGAAGTLSVGGLSGAVQVQLGASASMMLNGPAASGDSIAFSGAGAALTIGTAATYMAATLSGFDTGDDIIVNNTALTNAVYTYAGNNTGSLALYAGTTIVETLTLAGNYTGRTFFLSPTTSAGSAITLLAQPNGMPVLAAPLAVTLGTGQSAAITGIVLSETGNTVGELFTLTLSDSAGLLSVSSTAGVTGSGSTSLTLTGTLGQITADLATLTDTDSIAGSDTITLSALDGFGNIAASQTVAVTVNGLPTITSAGAQTLDLGTAASIAGISLNETGNIAGETFTVTLSDSNGTLSASGAGVSGAGTTNLTITGTLAQVNAALATLTDTDNVAGADTIVLNATDSFGNVAPTAQLGVTVNAQPPAPVTIGSGADTLALSVSEDAWQGDAQFTIDVDGQQVGGTLTASASHAAGQAQSFNVLGDFGPGEHNVTVTFLNDLDAGPGLDRNLYVDDATLNGATIANSALALFWDGAASFNFDGPPTIPPAPVTIGSGADTLALSVSEDAWQGDAQFSVAVDGQQIGGTLTAAASHAAGQTQLFNVLGDFGPGEHNVTVTFLNDLDDGPGLDRNLYVDGATLNGATIANSAIAFYWGGSSGFGFDGSAPAESGTLEVTGGGSAVMGASISDISTVLLASAPGNLSFTANASNGADTLKADGPNQTLTGGSGYDLLFGYAGGSTTFLGTTATMANDTIENFAAPNDIIDLTNLLFAANPSITFVENTAQTAGVLSVSDGSNSVTLTLAGVFDPAKFHAGADSGVGTMISYH